MGGKGRLELKRKGLFVSPSSYQFQPTGTTAQGNGIIIRSCSRIIHFCHNKIIDGIIIVEFEDGSESPPTPDSRAQKTGHCPEVEAEAGQETVSLAFEAQSEEPLDD